MFDDSRRDFRLERFSALRSRHGGGTGKGQVDVVGLSVLVRAVDNAGVEVGNFFAFARINRFVHQVGGVGGVRAVKSGALGNLRERAVLIGKSEDVSNFVQDNRVQVVLAFEDFVGVD